MPRPQSRSSPFLVVVDDYEDNREMYAEYFRFGGFTVATAKDGEEALARILANPVPRGGDVGT